MKGKKFRFGIIGCMSFYMTNACTSLSTKPLVNLGDIEFEDYTKLNEEERKVVIKFVTNLPEFDIKGKDKVEKECIIFKHNEVGNIKGVKNVETYIFLLNEDIYKAQTDEKVKKCIKQVDGEAKIYAIIGGCVFFLLPSGGSPIPKFDILSASVVKISKVEGSKNKYKVD